MFDVMIIDDDVQVRDRLNSIIDWESLPIQLTCVAGDSDTARELFLQYRPAIIITDINIPVITGLQLAEEFSLINPDVRFIVITGYSDFEYVRQSVKLGAVDLLSKPIFAEGINESLIKAVKYFEDKREAMASFSSLQQLVNSNLPVIQETYLSNLLRCKPDIPELVAGKLADLKINCPGPRFSVALVSVDKPHVSSQSQEAINMLLRETVRSVFSETDFVFNTFFDAFFRVNCIFCSDFESHDDLIEEGLNKVSNQIKFLTGCQVYAGIGQAEDHPALLFQSNTEATVALNYQSVLSDDTIIHYKNIEQLDNPFPNKGSLEHYVITQFRQNNFQAISDAVRQHIYSLASDNKDCDQHIRDFIFDYVSSIIRECMRLNIDIEEVEPYSSIVVSLFSEHVISNQLNYVLRLTEQLQKLLLKKRSNNANHLVSMAKDYIRSNLHDENLCLDSVSDHIGLSRIYFCKLFHKEEGISFNSFLNQERVDRAKQMLAETNMKVFEISDATGFSNAKYFSYVFKQITGIAPLEYQKQVH
ncbi:MAG: helix-turn-helix domain-containing protein [Eubacteriales bacterium]